MRSVASVSFGKDSLAMLLLLLERNTRLDEVIFYNSEMEFQAIYDIRDRIKPVLEQRGIRFTEVKPGVPFLYNMLDRPVDSKKNGFHLGYGWCGGPCRWGTKLKTRALDGVALDVDVHYVGIAADEPERLERLEAPKCSPLAEAGMTETDCLAYCYARGFFWEEDGIRLYDILDRVSCWCCKNKNRKELKAIYQFLPQYWERLKGLQAQIPMPMKPYSRKGVPYGNGLTQNVDDLLQSHTARTMLANSEFLVMLNQAATDRAELARLLNISDNQLSYITNVDFGRGLIKCGSAIVPFMDNFPKNRLYRLMTTKLSEQETS